MKDIADNQRWLDEHSEQVLHQGDLPIAPPPSERNSSEPETRDQQQ